MHHIVHHSYFKGISVGHANMDPPAIVRIFLPSWDRRSDRPLCLPPLLPATAYCPVGCRLQLIKAGTSSGNSYQLFPPLMLQEKHRQENLTQPWKEMRSPMGGFTHYNIDSWKLQHTRTHTHTRGQTGRAVLIDCPQRMKKIFQCLPFHRRIRRAQSAAYWQLQQAGKKCDKEKPELFFISRNANTCIWSEM